MAHWKWKFRRVYGITKNDFETLLAKQNNCCAICGRGFDWSSKKLTPHIDHCHVTKRVRGLLCDWCNKGLGNFEDDAAALQKAAIYLEEHVGRSAVQSNNDQPQGLVGN